MKKSTRDVVHYCPRKTLFSPRILETRERDNFLGKLGDLLKSKREEILHIAANRGATNVRIFGSVARDTDDENSDIDFLVELEPGRSLFDLGGLLMDLQDALKCKVDVVTEKGLKKRIRERVLKQATAL